MVMLKLIRTLLQQIIDDIDSGNSNISDDQQLEAIKLIQKFHSQDLSKLEAANYIGVSRATFDNYIRNGWLPKGTKRVGFKELSWKKCDLDEFLIKNKYDKRVWQQS